MLNKKDFSPTFRLFLIGAMLLSAQRLLAGIPVKPPKEKPIYILHRFNTTLDTTTLSRCLSYLNENFDQNSSPELVQELLKATKTAEKLNIHYISGLYSILKKYYDGINNKSKSFEYALKIYKLLSKTSQQEDLLWILVDIGNIFYNENDYEQATIFYNRAENIAKRGTDKYPLSVIYMNYGLVQADQGNHKEALKYYKISCKYREQSDNIKVISNTYIKIANTYLKLGQPESCLRYIQLAEDYYYNKGEKTAILMDMPDYIDFTYAEYYAYFKQYEKAFYHIRRAEDYCIKNGIIEEYIVDVDAESNYFFDQGQYQEAIRCISRLIPLLKRNEMLEEQKMLYKKLGKFYSASKEYAKADEAMKYYMELDDSLDFTILKSQLNMIRSISAVYESDATLQQTKKNLHIAKLNSRLSVRDRNTSIIVTLLAVLAITILLTLFMNLRSNRKKLLNIHEKLISQNREISENSAELEATNQLKDKLFSIIAHDLRNPLNRMLVELAIVKKSIAEKHLTTHMERTLKETIELFEGLLQWSKLDNKQNVYSPSKINLNDNINKVLSMYASEINARGIRVTKSTEPLFIFADQNIIQTLLRNLISNGIMFATKNEKNRVFEIEVYEIADSKVEIVVSNSGPKFSDETIAEFYSQDEYIMSSHTNLGLSICKLLAKMCNWHIEIENYTDRDGIFLTLQIPQFVSRKPALRKIIDPAFVLPAEFVDKLSGLKAYRFYQTSQIRAFLKSLDEIPDGTVRIWIENLEEAVHEGDEQTYKKLIEILDFNQVLPIDVN